MKILCRDVAPKMVLQSANRIYAGQASPAVAISVVARVGQYRAAECQAGRLTHGGCLDEATRAAIRRRKGSRGPT